MIISGGGITAGWERGEVACCVWAGSICSWRGSMRAVLWWVGLSVSEENRLVGTREPTCRSASHTDGRDESVWWLPHRWCHQPAGQLRPSAAQARKIWQRGADYEIYDSVHNNKCKYIFEALNFTLFFFRLSLELPPRSRERPSCLFCVRGCLFVPVWTWQSLHRELQDM